MPACVHVHWEDSGKQIMSCSGQDSAVVTYWYSWSHPVSGTLDHGRWVIVTPRLVHIASLGHRPAPDAMLIVSVYTASYSLLVIDPWAHDHEIRSASKRVRRCNSSPHGMVVKVMLQ
jgi:hypothetical protein